MQALTDWLYWVDDLLWGTPMIVILVGLGILLSIRFGFRYQRKIIYNFKNTYARIGREGEGNGTISGFKAACTALANTVGTGNISGVATAIVSGGPGALVWMWFSAFFGMSTKACEIILGQRYREHYSKSMDEYVCDRSFVLKNAFGMKKGAVALAVFCFLLGPWTCCVQTEAVTSSISEAFGVPTIITVCVIGVTCLVTIWGGLKRISQVMSTAVPIMAALYIIMGLGVLILNIREVPGVIALIFRSAFSPTIAIAVFAWTTIIGMYYTCEKSVNYAFGDTERNRKLMPVYMLYYMVPCVLLYNIEADILWAFTDILSAAYVAITVVFIIAKHREIFRLFDDFWKRYEPARERGENPPYVTFDCAREKGEDRICLH